MVSGAQHKNRKVEGEDRMERLARSGNHRVFQRRAVELPINYLLPPQERHTFRGAWLPFPDDGRHPGEPGRSDMFPRNGSRSAFPGESQNFE